MSLELTTTDLSLLEQYRLDRFRSFFANTLPLCFMHLDGNGLLKIHCSEAWIVDELLDGIQPLLWYAWLIVGARSLGLYFAQEQIIQSQTYLANQQCQQMQSL